MQVRQFAVTGTFVLLSALAISSVNTSAQTAAAVRTVNRVELLSRPSQDGDVVATIDAGTIVDVNDRDAQWLSVAVRSDEENGRHRGWIREADTVSLQSVAAPIRVGSPSSGSVAIAPSSDDIRHAQALREQQARVDAARQEVERLNQEFQASQRAHANADTAAPSTPTFKSLQAGHPKFDVFAGYSLLFDNTDSLTFGLGWIGAVAGNINDAVSIVGEASGSYKNVDALGVNLGSLNVHTFTGGPRFSSGSNGYTFYGQFLMGVNIASANSHVFGYSESNTGFVLEPGFGTDFPVTRGLAVRIGGEFPVMHNSGVWVNTFRLTTGLVILGKR